MNTVPKCGAALRRQSIYSLVLITMYMYVCEVKLAQQNDVYIYMH